MAKQGLDAPPIVMDRERGWVERLPERLRAYAVLARWDRPIGSWLLLLPGWWALALAPGGPDVGLVLLFAIGAVAMRGAGCVVNDLIDRDLDARVERTRHRPLASGRLSVAQALSFLALQLLVGALVLIPFNRFAIAVALASVPLIVIYPMMKRITWWPQAFLGITFNWGALTGWAAATGELAAPSLLLYAAGFFWTLGYDTIYAHQDKEDDALVGLKSTALKFGDATRRWLAAFYAGAVLLWGLAGILAGARIVFLLALAVALVQLAWQAATLDIHDAENCLSRFKSNQVVGWILFLGLVADMAFTAFFFHL